LQMGLIWNASFQQFIFILGGANLVFPKEPRTHRGYMSLSTEA